jgi:Protein of unknown function (DUF2934)
MDAATSAKWPTAVEYERGLRATEGKRWGLLSDGLTFERTRLDRLRVMAGGAGCVFQARDSAKRFALKVFTKYASGREERYAYIHEHLATAGSAVFVGFDFAKEGVYATVDSSSRSFPAVKMEWVPGMTLESAIEADKETYDADAWARKWLRVVQELRRSHTAHGDLQHKNIMVGPDGYIRLIDYDGMFVPAMRTQLSVSEQGHPAYQHPRRPETNDLFDEHLDGVSALVILTTLAAWRPELWRDRDDEGLLLTSRDLREHTHSVVLDELSHSPSPAPRLVELLREALDAPVGPCPQLERAASLYDMSLPGMGDTGARRIQTIKNALTRFRWERPTVTPTADNEAPGPSQKAPPAAPALPAADVWLEPSLDEMKVEIEDEAQRRSLSPESDTDLANWGWAERRVRIKYRTLAIAGTPDSRGELEDRLLAEREVEREMRIERRAREIANSDGARGELDNWLQAEAEVDRELTKERASALAASQESRGDVENWIRAQREIVEETLRQRARQQIREIPRTL